MGNSWNWSVTLSGIVFAGVDTNRSMSHAGITDSH
jgi:hypothetical protein